MTHPIQTYHRQPTSLNVTTQHVIHGQIIIVLSLTNNWGYRVSGVKHFGTLLENIEVVAHHHVIEYFPIHPECFGFYVKNQQ